MATDIDVALRGLLPKDLRVQCRARGLTPAGGQDALRQRLKEHMMLTNDYSFAPVEGSDSQEGPAYGAPRLPGAGGPPVRTPERDLAPGRAQISQINWGQDDAAAAPPRALPRSNSRGSDQGYNPAKPAAGAPRGQNEGVNFGSYNYFRDDAPAGAPPVPSGAPPPGKNVAAGRPPTSNEGVNFGNYNYFRDDAPAGKPPRPSMPDGGAPGYDAPAFGRPPAAKEGVNFGNYNYWKDDEGGGKPPRTPTGAGPVGGGYGAAAGRPPAANEGVFMGDYDVHKDQPVHRAGNVPSTPQGQQPRASDERMANQKRQQSQVFFGEYNSRADEASRPQRPSDAGDMPALPAHVAGAREFSGVPPAGRRTPPRAEPPPLAARVNKQNNGKPSQIFMGDHQLPYSSGAATPVGKPAKQSSDPVQELDAMSAAIDIDNMIRPLLLKDLRVQLRLRGLNPAGGLEPLRERLKEHMLATGDFSLRSEDGAVAAPPPYGYEERGHIDQNRNNNYARPGGQQNVGNFITDKPSSRVLAPPGGQSKVVFGDYSEPPQQRSPPPPQGPYGSPYGQPPPYAVQAPPPQAPYGSPYGQPQYPPQGAPGGTYSPARPGEAYGAMSSEVAHGRLANNYARPNGQQNVGNFITDRPSSRVLAPPGGKSQISFG